MFTLQRCNRGEIFGAPLRCWGRICPPPLGWNRVKVSENLGATTVVPVAHADTSLLSLQKGQTTKMLSVEAARQIGAA